MNTAQLLKEFVKLNQPCKYPIKGPKADVHQETNPVFEGNLLPNSAVIRASGIDQNRGKRMKPVNAQNGPADMADSLPKGPPQTVKKTMATSDHRDKGFSRREKSELRMPEDNALSLR